MCIAAVFLYIFVNIFFKILTYWYIKKIKLTPEFTNCTLKYILKNEYPILLIEYINFITTNLYYKRIISISKALSNDNTCVINFIDIIKLKKQKIKIKYPISEHQNKRIYIYRRVQHPVENLNHDILINHCYQLSMKKKKKTE